MTYCSVGSSELVTAAEAAQLLEVSAPTIYVWGKRGKISRRFLSPHRLRYLRSELTPALKARPARTHCRHGHALTPENTITRQRRDRWGGAAHTYTAVECRRCKAATAKRSYDRRRPPMLMTAGGSYQARTVKSWATRRARYGPSGYTPTGRQAISRSGQTLARLHNPHAGKTHCANGHRFTKVNTRWRLTRRNGRIYKSRRCIQCQHIYKRGRPAWLEQEGGKVSIAAHDDYFAGERRKLFLAQLTAHPDRGGTAAKFISARHALERFLETERQWYAAYGLTIPDTRSRATAA